MYRSMIVTGTWIGISSRRRGGTVPWDQGHDVIIPGTQGRAFLSPKSLAVAKWPSCHPPKSGSGGTALRANRPVPCDRVLTKSTKSTKSTLLPGDGGRDDGRRTRQAGTTVVKPLNPPGDGSQTLNPVHRDRPGTGLRSGSGDTALRPNRPVPCDRVLTKSTKSTKSTLVPGDGGRDDGRRTRQATVVKPLNPPGDGSQTLNPVHRDRPGTGLRSGSGDTALRPNRPGTQEPGDDRVEPAR